jgi:hypothetical protein
MGFLPEEKQAFFLDWTGFQEVFTVSIAQDKHRRNRTDKAEVSVYAVFPIVLRRAHLSKAVE